MNIFLENLKENAFTILGSFVFVTIAIAFNGFGNSFMYWLTILFFGLGGLLLLFKPFLPTPQPADSRYTPNIDELTDLGVFNFDEPELFSIYSNEMEFNCYWEHIETLIGYIDDERIALQIYIRDKSHILLQDFTLGWYRFHAELHLRFPSVSPTWFEENEAFENIILYDRKNRSKSQIEVETYYPL